MEKLFDLILIEKLLSLIELIKLIESQCFWCVSEVSSCCVLWINPILQLFSDSCVQSLRSGSRRTANMSHMSVILFQVCLNVLNQKSLCCGSFLSPAGGAQLMNVSLCSNWTNPFFWLSGHCRAWTRCISELYDVGKVIDFYSDLKRFSDADPPDAAVWRGAFAHAQRRRWKPKSVLRVKRFHSSAASALGQRHVIKRASDWLIILIAVIKPSNIKYLIQNI